MLSGRQPQEGRYYSTPSGLPPILQISYSRRRRGRPYPRDRLSPPGRFILTRNPLDHFIERIDPLIKPRQITPQILKQAPEAAQPVLHLLANPRQGAPQLLDALRHDDPVPPNKPRIWLAVAVRCRTRSLRIRRTA